MSEHIETSVDEIDGEAICELNLELGVTGADHAADAIGKVADAFERLNAEIEKLSGISHGGISLRIIGEIAELKIEPSA